MKLDEFDTNTYVRRPFQVQAFEITQDNIAELAPHVGELCDDNGTPFIKSDKKKVGNNFKVWPGFFATVLKGHVRCYSRKSFFEQFGELNDKTSPVVEFLHGRCTLEEMLDVLAPSTVEAEPEEEAVIEVEVEVEIDLEAVELLDADETAAETGSFPQEPVATCEHGTPADRDCAYRPCDGIETDEEDDSSEIVAIVGEDGEAPTFVRSPESEDLFEETSQESPEPAEAPSALEQYRAGLESVIKP